MHFKIILVVLNSVKLIIDLIKSKKGGDKNES